MTADEALWDAVDEGVELLRAGEVDAAVKELTRVIQDSPQNHYAFYFLGQAHYEREAYDKALKAYVESLTLVPHYKGALIGTGHTLRHLGRLNEALKVGRQALALDKEDPDALYLLGVIHFTRGEDQMAQALLNRFLDTRPEIEVAIEVQGMLETLKGNIVTPEED